MSNIDKAPEAFAFYSVDEVAETIEGLKSSTREDLWNQLNAAVEAGTAKPLGGDCTRPSSPGVVGTTEEPIVSSGEYGSDLVTAWRNLSEESRVDILEAAEREVNARWYPDLMVGDITCRARAHAGLELLVAFAKDTGLVGEHPHVVLGDIICNCMHAFKAMGLDPDLNVEEAVHKAGYHFQEENDVAQHEGEEPPQEEIPSLKHDIFA